VDALKLIAPVEQGNAKGLDAGCASNTDTIISGTDKFTSECSLKDRLSSDGTTSSVQSKAPNEHQMLANGPQSGCSSQQTESYTFAKHYPEKNAQKSCLDRLTYRAASLVEEAGLNNLEIPVSLDVKSNSSGPSHLTENVEDNLDIKVLDQAAHKKSCYLGVGSWISDDEVSGINTPVSSNRATDEEVSQNPRLLLDRSNSLIRSAAGEPSRSKQAPRRSSNAGGASGRASRQGGSDGTQKPPTRGRENKDLESDSEEDEPNSARKRKRTETDGRRFACPFFKHDPEFHTASEQDILRYRSCVAGPGWRNIARLK
jgi:hypothetical protein